jgi:glutamine amidotransferase
VPALSLGAFACLGETDSEYAFCHLLSVAEPALRQHDWERVRQTMQAINAFGTFNCLLTDGDFLAVYSDQSGYKNLHALHRRPPSGPITLADDDYRIDLTQEPGAAEWGYLFATRPLTREEAWQPLGPGSLVVASQGRITWSSEPTVPACR